MNYSDVAHLDWQYVGDQTSNVHIDPDDLISDRVPRFVWFGLVRRWQATDEGQCPCGARLWFPNRATRRSWERRGQQVWLGMVVHFEGCPAVAEPVRKWIHQNPRGA